MFFIITTFQNIIKFNPSKHGTVSRICKTFAFPEPFGLYSIPQFSSSLYSFTFIYLFLPMMAFGMFNVPLLISILTFYVIDLVIKVNGNWVQPLGVLFGTIMGIVWGTIFYTILSHIIIVICYFTMTICPIKLHVLDRLNKNLNVEFIRMENYWEKV